MAQGAIEFGASHYPLFFILHTAWFVAWIAEARITAQLSGIWPLWLVLFMGAQLLRYWCIASLGYHWNTRILVIPGHKAVHKGPYRFVSHPNYIAVAMELLCVPMMFGAAITAAVFTILNAALLLFIRIPEEAKALRRLS